MAETFPRVAVIGAGAHASRRIYPYLAAAGAKLVGTCDLDAERAGRTAELFGGRSYQDWEAMVAAEEPEAVLVCIGPEAHAELAVALLERDIAVYTEKPPAATAEAALAVARTAARTGRLCVTAFKKRYSRAYVRARALIDEFSPAEHRLLAIDYASAPYANDTPRRLFLLDYAIHIIDLARWLFGEVEEVFCYRHGLGSWAVCLRYASGAVGTLSLTDGRTFALPTEEVEITLGAESFMSIRNSASWRIVRNGAGCEWREPQTFISAGDDGRDTGHLAELEDFVTALREGRKTSRSAIADSYRSLVLLEAIVTAGATGGPVAVRPEPV